MDFVSMAVQVENDPFKEMGNKRQRSKPVFVP